MTKKDEEGVICIDASTSEHTSCQHPQGEKDVGFQVVGFMHKGLSMEWSHQQLLCMYQLCSQKIVIV